MKRTKVTFALLIAMCLIWIVSACSGSSTVEYESEQSFEYHFYPEEYEEAYSEISKTLPLESGKDYQIQIEANCTSGSMEIQVCYEDDETLYIVDIDTPCNDTITIPADTTDKVEFIVSIEPDTEGMVIGETLVQK